jgi:hypothetical protein
MRAVSSDPFLLKGFRFGNFHDDSAAMALAAMTDIARNTNRFDRELFTAIPPTERRKGAEKELATFPHHNKGGECRRSEQKGPDRFTPVGRQC